MARMLGRHRRGSILANPVHQLHDILVHVLLANLAVRTDDMREQPLRAVAAWRLVGELLAGVRERLAVEGAPDDRTAGPKEARAETLDDAASRRAVGQREQAVAEVEQHERAVVGLGREAAAAELALLDARAGKGGNASRRAEDGGQGVERVDG